MADASTVLGYGIRVNALCPSFVQTDLFANIPSRLGQFAQLAAATDQIVEKFGMLNMSEVAEALLELVTDETRNGQALVVVPNERKYITFPPMAK